MIKHKMTDIDVLLSGLLLFSIIVGGLHHVSLTALKEGVTKKTEVKKAVAKQESENPWETSSLEDIQESIQPLIESESVEKLVEELAGISLDKMIPILKGILENDQKFLDRDDRIEVLFGIAAAYKTPQEKNAVLDLIVNPDPKYQYLQQGNPIIYVAATSKYPHAIPMIKEWYENKIASQANAAQLRENLQANALAHAVEEKKLAALEAMLKYGVAMTKDRMNVLLHDAVHKKAGAGIVTFMIRQGADINNAIKGYSPLLEAIRNGDFDMVKLLVEQGADVNLIADNSVGNALQVAESAVRAAEKRAQAENKDPKKAAKTAVDIKEYLIEHQAQD